MKKKILVVVDMQNDFITGPLGNEACKKVVPVIKDLIENSNWDKIIFTQDTHFENYLDTQEGKKLPVPHCISETSGWQIVPELEEICPEEKFLHIAKPTFGSKALADLLTYTANKYGAENTDIYFCGVCTGICVLSNVTLVKAFIPEAELFVFSQACACVTPESHNTALEAMKMIQVNII